MDIIIGFFGGIVLVFLLLISDPPSAVVEAKRVISECEKTLPRNQVCELYAKPREQIK